MINKLKKALKFCKCHKVISILVTVAIIVLIGYLLWPKSSKEIKTFTVQEDTFVQTVTANGKVTAENSVNLNFLAGGKLVWLGAKKGDTVSKYQTIAVLDQRTVKKNIENALISYSLQRLDFDQTQEDYDYRTPEQALNDTMKRLLEKNQYDLNKTIISVELQDLIKEQSIITSPISGILTRADVETPGINITAATTYTVTDPTSMIFEIDIDEADISNIKPSQGVIIELDAYPSEQVEGTIKYIDFVTHKTSTGGDAFTIKVKLPENIDLKYKVGMNGNAEIQTYKKDKIISVPISSITDDNYVYVKINSKFEKRKVKVGLQNDTEMEILEGLAEDDEIAIDPTLISNNGN